MIGWTGFSVATNYFIDPSRVGPPTFATFCIALDAAAGEEVMFRAIPIALMMYMAKDSKRLLVVLILSSVLFGLSHFYNLTNGAALDTTIMQVISTIGAGFIFGALYLRTSSIIPCMVYHFRQDFLATMVVSNSTGVMTHTNIPIGTFIGMICVSVMSLCVGLYLLRKSKSEEVLATWADKWSK